MAVYLIGVLIFAAGIAVFVVQNTALVTVQFINWVYPEVSLAFVILAAALLGALTAFLLDSIRYFKVAKQVKELMSANRRLEKELRSLKEPEKSSDDNVKSNPLSTLSRKMRKEISRREGKKKTDDSLPPPTGEDLGEQPVEELKS
jgi:uncharacterized integral membrane protein